MTTQLTIRGSSADRIAACPASVVPPVVSIDLADDAAKNGTGAHEVLSDFIEGRDVDLMDTCRRVGADPVEVEHLFRVGRSLWGRIAGAFPNAITEHEFDPVTFGAITFTGHADVVSMSDDGSTIALLDWKTGWGDFTHEQQLRVYATLALHDMPMADSVRATVAKLRHGDLETWEWSRQELIEWAEDLSRRTSAQRESYRPSVEACGYCPRAHECPARINMVATAIAVVKKVADVAADSEALRPGGCLSVDDMADALTFSRTLSKWCDLVNDLVKAETIRAGGELQCVDGRRLEIKETPRTSIDYAAGHGVLWSHIGEALTAFLKVSKTEAVKAVRATAKRGQKDAAEERLLQELDQAGALKLSASPRLEIIQAAKAIEAKQ
jgi:hypothetical protein